jgi:hypothetical protein
MSQNDTDTDKMLFSNLVVMLSSSAMQQLGKIVNPLNNKTEVNLEAAQVTIDMLTMIKNKTEGNLDQDESKMLSDILASLQMNYVETAESAKNSPPPDDAADAGSEATPATPPGPAAPPPEGTVDPGKGPKDAKDPKFHKSYGS